MSESAGSVKDSQNEVEKPPTPLRDDLVSTAVKFLINPRVSTRPRSEKEAFLSKKGLTTSEITAAFAAAGVPEQDTAVEHYSSVKTVARVHEYSSAVTPVYTSRWTIIRDIVNTIILLAGAAYGLQYLYKRFLGPWLFGTKPKKALEETVDEMNKNLTRLVGDVATAVRNLNDTVTAMRQKEEKSELKELKSEVASLKALLLSRRQFPPPPTISAVTAPSIPSWQLGPSSSQKLDLHLGVETADDSLGRKGSMDALGGGNSPSSSPEIISVEDMSNSNLPSAQPDAADIISASSVSVSSHRDPSESSETGSAEMVDLAIGGASGEESGDTD